MGTSRRIDHLSDAPAQSRKAFGEAARSAVEQLEGRLLFAAFVQPGAGGAAKASALINGSQTVPLDDTLQSPANFRAITQNLTAITLGWDPVAGATGYTLYRAVRNNDATV